MPLDPLHSCCRAVQPIKAASFCIVLFIIIYIFLPSFIFHPVSHSERTALSSIVSKSRTSQSIRVCSSHFLLSLLVFFLFLGFWWHFQSARSLPWDTVHVPTPLHPQTHKLTHIESRYTHSSPRASPCVLIHLREAGAWHRRDTLVDSVLRLPMLHFWSAASWWQIYIKRTVFSCSLRFSPSPPWHWGKMLR